MELARWISIIALIWTQGSPAPQSVFRSEAHTIPIYATVRGRDGRLVSRLGRQDFRILVDGQPVEVTQFSSEVQPVTVAIMIDRGMGPRMARVLETAHRFVDALLPADTATIGSFSGGVAVSPHLTSDHRVLHRVVDEEIWPTASPDSPWTGIERAMSALEGRGGVRVVLVLSSGGEGGVVSELRARAAREDVMIYGVLFEGTMLDRLHKGACAAGARCTSLDGKSFMYFSGSPPGKVLNPLAELTGGGHFTIRDSDGLAAIMSDLAEELRGQYVLGFTPPRLDGKAHDVRVQTVPSGLTVRARNSYIARPSR